MPASAFAIGAVIQTRRGTRCVVSDGLSTSSGPRLTLDSRAWLSR